MILGDENVIPEKDKFNSISITVGNSRKLLLNLDSFGFVNVPTPELINALNEQPKTPNFDKAKRPVLAYFNGDCEIFKQETQLGIIILAMLRALKLTMKLLLPLNFMMACMLMKRLNKQI